MEKFTGGLEAFERRRLRHRHHPAGAGAESAEQWPGYLSFITSFFSILIIWVHHHAMFRLVRRTDARLLFANSLLLMMVTLIPFPRPRARRWSFIALRFS